MTLQKDLKKKRKCSYMSKKEEILQNQTEKRRRKYSQAKPFNYLKGLPWGIYKDKLKPKY